MTYAEWRQSVRDSMRTKSDIAIRARIERRHDADCRIGTNTRVRRDRLRRLQEHSQRVVAEPGHSARGRHALIIAAIEERPDLSAWHLSQMFGFTLGPVVARMKAMGITDARRLNTRRPKNSRVVWRKRKM